MGWFLQAGPGEREKGRWVGTCQTLWGYTRGYNRGKCVKRAGYTAACRSWCPGRRFIDLSNSMQCESKAANVWVKWGMMGLVLEWGIWWKAISQVNVGCLGLPLQPLSFRPERQPYRFQALEQTCRLRAPHHRGTTTRTPERPRQLGATLQKLELSWVQQARSRSEQCCRCGMCSHNFERLCSDGTPCRVLDGLACWRGGAGTLCCSLHSAAERRRTESGTVLRRGQVAGLRPVQQAPAAAGVLPAWPRRGQARCDCLGPASQRSPWRGVGAGRSCRSKPSSGWSAAPQRRRRCSFV
mmetsp:Transcript_9019/g.25912  ORF Transcript_9019/g.25912 Transcript_9019/m.25912 type:complete len:297 (-) Transcript_9019:701-1591(-)